VRFARTLLALPLLACAVARGQQADEVPFVVTPDNVTLAMLQLAKVGPEDYLIDLGSGDGRIVITAARKYGARGLGVELVADLVAKSREAARAAGVADKAHFREQDLFKTDLSPASVVTMYLLPEVNLQLRPRLLQLRPGTRLVSHDWDMGEWEPDRSVVVDAPDKTVGLEKRSKVHLWIVPARVDGTWCGTGKWKGATLRIEQKFQKFRAQVAEPGGARDLDGRIAGNVLQVKGGLALTADGARIKATYAAGKNSALKNATFTRARGQSCK